MKNRWSIILNLNTGLSGHPRAIKGHLFSSRRPNDQDRFFYIDLLTLLRQLNRAFYWRNEPRVRHLSLYSMQDIAVWSWECTRPEENDEFTPRRLSIFPIRKSLARPLKTSSGSLPLVLTARLQDSESGYIGWRQNSPWAFRSSTVRCEISPTHAQCTSSM